MSAGYPSPTAVFPMARARPPSASTAESLVLVALVLQVIAAAFLIVGVLALFAWTAFHPFPYWGVALVVTAAIGAVAVLFLYAAYEFSYLRIQSGDYAGAQAPTLIIGILSLFLGLIPGILYLVGYAKLTDAIREQAYPAGYGMSMPSYAQIACRACGKVYPAGQYQFCPACGQKMGG